MEWIVSLVTGASVGLVVLVGLWIWKPWAAAYSGEKGKNFARKEDLEAILAEVRAVTITQKEIEKTLSGDLWHEQQRRNEKKELYAEIFGTLHKEMKELRNLILAMDSGEALASQRAHCKVVEDLEVELVREVTLASVFLAEDVFRAFQASPAVQVPGAPTREWAVRELERVISTNTRVLEICRIDLRIG